MAAQGSCVMPTTGTVSGLTFTININNCFDATQTANSGASAPANTAGAPGIGQIWLDTSTTPINRLKMWDGASWLLIATMDATNHVWDAPIGGGTATLASATTTDLCSVSQSTLTISGTTPITGFSNTCQPGQIKALTFSGALLLTHNATSMILPNNGNNITTVAGATAWAAYLGGGNWRVLSYQKPDGSALNASADFTGAVAFDSALTITLASSTDDWTPASFSTANVIKLTCSSAINITGLVAPTTDGRTVAIDNVGATNPCTFTSQGSTSAAGNRFALPWPVSVPPGGSIVLKYDLANARWRAFQNISSQAIAGGYKNLRVFNVATYQGDTAPASPNSQMKIAAEAVTLEDANGVGYRLKAVACTIAGAGNAFSAGSGGLDTGSLAAGNWYSEWVIYNPTTNTQSCLASLSATLSTITLPSGYTFGSRVGWNYYLTNNSVTGFQRIVQYGAIARYAATLSTPTPSMPQPTISGGAALVTSYVPSTAAEVDVVIANAAGNNPYQVAPNASYSTLISGSVGANPPPLGYYAVAGSAASMLPITMSLESSSVFTNASNIFVRGWRDNL
jgi:hypothetical protein